MPQPKCHPLEENFSDHSIHHSLSPCIALVFPVAPNTLGHNHIYLFFPSCFLLHYEGKTFVLFLEKWHLTSQAFHHHLLIVE